MISLNTSDYKARETAPSTQPTQLQNNKTSAPGQLTGNQLVHSTTLNCPSTFQNTTTPKCSSGPCTIETDLISSSTQKPAAIFKITAFGLHGLVLHGKLIPPHLASVTLHILPAYETSVNLIFFNPNNFKQKTNNFFTFCHTFLVLIIIIYPNLF